MAQLVDAGFVFVLVGLGVVFGGGGVAFLKFCQAPVIKTTLANTCGNGASSVSW
jgi:hypothetical protein